MQLSISYTVAQTDSWRWRLLQQSYAMSQTFNDWAQSLCLLAVAHLLSEIQMQINKNYKA